MHIKSSLNPGDPGAKLFPLIGCGILFACGIGMLLRKNSEEKTAFLTKKQWIRALTLFLMYVVYFFLLWLVGYKVALPVVLLILCVMFVGTRRSEVSLWKLILKAVIYALLVSGAIYVFYVLLLDSSLPEGIIWKLLKK